MALIAYGSCASIQDANSYMDRVFEQTLPGLIRAKTTLHPYALIGSFQFKVDSTSVTNRDLKVNVTEGQIRDLDSAVHRIGECHAPALINGNTTISCTFAIRPINITYTAVTQGDSLRNRVKTIWVRVTVEEGSGRFEATGQRRKDAALSTFVVEHLKFKVKNDKDLSLNDDRKKDFRKEFEKKTQTKLYEVFYNEYRQVLERAVAATNYPQD